VITKQLTRNACGEVVLSLRVTGAADVYRVARDLQKLDGELASKGTLILHGLRLLVGRAKYEGLAVLHFGRRDHAASPERTRQVEAA
jgi:hypothetical protein